MHTQFSFDPRHHGDSSSCPGPHDLCGSQDLTETQLYASCFEIWILRQLPYLLASPAQYLLDITHQYMCSYSLWLLAHRHMGHNGLRPDSSCWPLCVHRGLVCTSPHTRVDLHIQIYTQKVTEVSSARKTIRKGDEYIDSSFFLPLLPSARIPY